MVGDTWRIGDTFRIPETDTENPDYIGNIYVMIAWEYPDEETGWLVTTNQPDDPDDEDEWLYFDPNHVEKITPGYITWKDDGLFDKPVPIDVW